MTDEPIRERLREIRRDLHRYPEPAWCEYYTLSRIVDEIERVGVDELHLGRDALVGDRRLAVPDEEELTRWREAAADAGARRDVLERAKGGHTGAVAVVENGDGPTVALRVDVDAIRQREADDPDHAPAARGFRSVNEGVMHACGHDAHATIGLAVLDAVARSDEFRGTFKLLVQPAEERAGGGKALAASRHVADVDHLLGFHVGLDHPTGEVVGGIVKPLAVTNFDVRFRGTAAHAGKNPDAGRSAVRAAATAVGNLHAISRHADGPTRVNAGRIRGGTARNVVAERATLECEARGETTALMEYAVDRARRVVRAAGEMHGCESEFEVTGEAPRADSDPGLSGLVADAARGHDAVTSVRETSEFGASEDVTYLMKAVQERGGEAAYAVVGTDHPADHHAPRFDVDEESLAIGVDVLSDAVVALGA
jgi:aminobenzoyl-glutamate utilization protein A